MRPSLCTDRVLSVSQGKIIRTNQLYPDTNYRTVCYSTPLYGPFEVWGCVRVLVLKKSGGRHSAADAFYPTQTNLVIKKNLPFQICKPAVGLSQKRGFTPETLAPVTLQLQLHHQASEHFQYSTAKSIIFSYFHSHKLCPHKQYNRTLLRNIKVICVICGSKIGPKPKVKTSSQIVKF